MPPTSTVLFSGVGLTIRSGPDGINMSAGEERERSANSVSSDVGPPGEESSMDDFDDARSGTPVKDDTVGVEDLPPRGEVYSASSADGAAPAAAPAAAEASSGGNLDPKLLAAVNSII